VTSADLREAGAASWLRFHPDSESDLLGRVPPKQGVYVIRRGEQFGRFIGETDIVYIGCAASASGLRGRLYGYFHPGPTQTTNQRMSEFSERLGDLEVAYIVCSTADDAKRREKLLLHSFEAEHGELPPLNRQT
jgi:hypothetical protein